MDLLSLSKKQTLWVFVVIYLFAIIIGALIMLYGVNTQMDMVLTGFLSTVAMTIIIFLFSNIIKNASLYDPYWSVIPVVIIVEWMIIYQVLSLNVILLLVATLVWSVRLTYNWWKNWSGFKHQDWRYTHLHDQAPNIYFITNFFGIHMIPTVVVYIQLINAHDIMGYQGISPLFGLGFVFSVGAAVIQFIADKQMYEFRLCQNKEKPCIDEGLWKYSRHPNYLGELLFWVGIYVMYLSYVRTININLVYPLLMIMLFLFISIPMMERKLANRPGYQEYKDTVSMLIPFRKKQSK